MLERSFVIHAIDNIAIDIFPGKLNRRSVWTIAVDILYGRFGRRNYRKKYNRMIGRYKAKLEFLNKVLVCVGE